MDDEVDAPAVADGPHVGLLALALRPPAGLALDLGVDAVTLPGENERKDREDVSAALLPEGDEAAVDPGRSRAVRPRGEAQQGQFLAAFLYELGVRGGATVCFFIGHQYPLFSAHHTSHARFRLS